MNSLGVEHSITVSVNSNSNSNYSSFI